MRVPNPMRALLTLSFVLACSHPPAAQAPAPRPPPAQTAAAELCPMDVAGVVLRVEPVEHGAALVFTTDKDVAEVRRRVRLMARAARASPARLLDDVPGGARIVFHPAGDIDGFREQLTAQADRFAGGECTSLMPPAPRNDIANR